jgi:hypothetical protein
VTYGTPREVSSAESDLAGSRGHLANLDLLRPRDAVAAGRPPAQTGAWSPSEVRRLNGLDVDGVDYSVAADV